MICIPYDLLAPIAGRTFAGDCAGINLGGPYLRAGLIITPDEASHDLTGDYQDFPVTWARLGDLTKPICAFVPTA
jgi:hypothetical protein